MILQLQNIFFAFTGKAYLLENISLPLGEKQIYALMGSNGAGKTTLFNLINGFIKPLRGEMIFNSEKITNFSPYRINRIGIGRTFQNLRIITKLTVKENIILAMRLNPSDNWLNAMLPENFHRKTNQKFDKKAEEIIDKCFLGDVKKSIAAEISYGQQKLLSLACCVANDATLLLLDEAVAGIQPEYRKKIALLIKQFKEEGRTIFLIEHNTDFIAEVAEKIFFLHEGKITLFDNIEALREDKQVVRAYI